MGKPTKKGRKAMKKMRSSAKKAKDQLPEFKPYLVRAASENDTYTVIYMMSRHGSHSTLKGAIREMFALVRKGVDAGELSAMVLEQGGVGIECMNDSRFQAFMPRKRFLNFYRVRDLGYETGLIVDGNVVD